MSTTTTSDAAPPATTDPVRNPNVYPTKGMSLLTTTYMQNTEDAPAELSAVVDELLNSLSTKFSSVSKDILEKMDDMSRRLDSLEATIQGGNGNGNSGAGESASGQGK
ncbi:MAG: hypothetical protein M1819_005101 [Sarea resinae]|nr:MAG: hypothetical protein M1819_005101 [Sarea resinae]